MPVLSMSPYLLSSSLLGRSVVLGGFCTSDIALVAVCTASIGNVSSKHMATVVSAQRIY